MNPPTILFSLNTIVVTEQLLIPNPYYYRPQCWKLTMEGVQ